jgi:hypothetical protein
VSEPGLPPSWPVGPDWTQCAEASRCRHVGPGWVEVVGGSSDFPFACAHRLPRRIPCRMRNGGKISSWKPCNMAGRGRLPSAAGIPPGDVSGTIKRGRSRTTGCDLFHLPRRLNPVEHGRQVSD